MTHIYRSLPASAAEILHSYWHVTQQTTTTRHQCILLTDSQLLSKVQHRKAESRSVREVGRMCRKKWIICFMTIKFHRHYKLSGNSCLRLIRQTIFL